MFVIYDHPWMIKPPEDPHAHHRRNVPARAKRKWRRSSPAV